MQTIDALICETCSFNEHVMAYVLENKKNLKNIEKYVWFFQKNKILK